METVAGTYIITYVLVYSDGPWGLFWKIRENKYVKSFGAMECYPCMAFWTALALSAVLPTWEWLLIAWAVSSLVDRFLNAYMVK